MLAAIAAAVKPHLLQESEVVSIGLDDDGMHYIGPCWSNSTDGCATTTHDASNGMLKNR